MLRTAAVIGAVLALGAWIVFCLAVQPPRIEEELQLETERALATAGLGGVRAVVSGRDAKLEGLVASAAVLAEAERLVAGIAGVRTVDNLLTVREAVETEPATYLEISVGAHGVSLRGAVPSEALRRQVSGRAQQLFGVDRVDERLRVDATVQGGAALASAADVISALAEVGEGVRARLKGDSLRLSGTVASTDVRRRIERQARTAAPGVRLFFSALEVSEGRAGGAPTELRRAEGAPTELRRAEGAPTELHSAEGAQTERQRPGEREGEGS